MYNVEVETKKWIDFKKYPGIKQISKDHFIIKGLTLEDAKKITLKLRLHFYFAYYYEEMWDRSTKYRRKWMKNHKDEEYRCVYCGRYYPKESLSIDHIFPVSTVKQSRFLQRRLLSKGYTGINDIKNLVPSCYQCNDEKSDILSWNWIIRAWLGKNETYWRFKNILKLSLIFIIAILTLYILWRNI